VPRRPHELDPETLSIIIRSEDIDDFNIASVTGPGIGMVHPKRFAKRLSAKTF
jgi:hypothetical protein